MQRNTISATAILLCALVLGTLFIREKCRLGDIHLPVCSWMGIPHAGGTFPNASNLKSRAFLASSPLGIQWLNGYVLFLAYSPGNFWRCCTI
jgi:hypothetical protein